MYGSSTTEVDHIELSKEANDKIKFVCYPDNHVIIHTGLMTG